LADLQDSLAKAISNNDFSSALTLKGQIDLTKKQLADNDDGTPLPDPTFATQGDSEDSLDQFEARHSTFTTKHAATLLPFGDLTMFVSLCVFVLVQESQSPPEEKTLQQQFEEALVNRDYGALAREPNVLSLVVLLTFCALEP